MDYIPEKRAKLNPLSALALFTLFLALFTGCGDSVNKKELNLGHLVNINGSLNLGQLNVNSDIVYGFNGSIRARILSDFSLFQVSIGGQKKLLNKDGTFSFENFPAAASYLIQVRLVQTPSLLFEKLIESNSVISGTLSPVIDLESTAVAAILTRAREKDRRLEEKDLTFSQIQKVSNEMRDRIERSPEAFFELNAELKKIPGVVTVIESVVEEFQSDGSDMPQTDFTPPVITDLELQAFEHSATVRWLTTGDPATSQVEYSSTSSITFNLTGPVDIYTENHEVVLTNLLQDVFYYYRVRTTDKSGNTAYSSPVGSFIISSNNAQLYDGFVFNKSGYNFASRSVTISADRIDALFSLASPDADKVTVTMGDSVDWRIKKIPSTDFATDFVVSTRNTTGWTHTSELGLGGTFAFADGVNKRGIGRIKQIANDRIDFEYLYPIASKTSELATGTIKVRGGFTSSGNFHDVAYDFSASDPESGVASSTNGVLMFKAIPDPSAEPYYKIRYDQSFKIYESDQVLSPFTTLTLLPIPFPQVVDDSKLAISELSLKEDKIYHFRDYHGRYGAFRITDQEPYASGGGTGSGKLDVQWVYQKAFIEGSTTVGSHFLEP